MLKNYRLPILTGIFIGTSYIPFPPWAILFALVPLWIWWLEQNSLKKILIGGWVSQFILTLIGFNWVAHTVHEFGDLPWPVAIVTLLLFASFASLHVPISGALWWGIARLCKRQPRELFFLLPATFIVAEFSYPMIFDWHLGYPVIFTGLPAMHLAEWVGARGLSAIIVSINAILLFAYLYPGLRKQALTITAALLTATMGLGHWIHSRLPTPDAQSRVALVQANIGNLEKQEAERGSAYREHIIERYFKLTETALKHGTFDFVVWPETAMPIVLNEPYYSSQANSLRLQEFVRTNQVHLITGAYGYEGDRIFNSVYTLNPNAQITAPPYSKTILLAFGEYFPGADLFPFLRKLVPAVGQFGRGAGPSLQKLSNHTIGPLICYEGIIESFARKVGQKGPQFLVNLTNDSWYGKWQQPWQHLYMTLSRAIEQRRPMIRSTNTGISTIMLADGTILEQSPLHQEWFHLYEVPYYQNPPQTFYLGAGYYFPWVVATLLALVALGRRKKI